MDPGSQGSRSGNLRFPGSPNVRDDWRSQPGELRNQDTGPGANRPEQCGPLTHSLAARPALKPVIASLPEGLRP